MKPLKVICIDNSNLGHGTATELTEGQEYTVLNELLAPSGELGYLLAEVKSDQWKGTFYSKRFIPVSNIDETEFVRETKKELI